MHSDGKYYTIYLHLKWNGQNKELQYAFKFTVLGSQRREDQGSMDTVL